MLCWLCRSLSIFFCRGVFLTSTDVVIVNMVTRGGAPWLVTVWGSNHHRMSTWWGAVDNAVFSKFYLRSCARIKGKISLKKWWKGVLDVLV
jgi:hypothetical protein